MVCVFRLSAYFATSLDILPVKCTIAYQCINLMRKPMWAESVAKSRKFGLLEMRRPY